jgi:hypothetical protein
MVCPSRSCTPAKPWWCQSDKRTPHTRPMPLVFVMLIAVLVGGFGTPAHAAVPQSDPSWPRHIGWRGCPEPSYPKKLSTGSPANGARVLVIGDSLTREARPWTTRALRADGWTPTIRCWGGKRLDWGISQVRRARALKQLPDTVVIALGTNDMSYIDQNTTRRRVVEILDLLGPKRTVVWINTHFSGGLAPSRAREAWFNGLLVDQARERDNLVVLDWAKYAREIGVRSRDGVHYRSDGSKARAEALRAILADVAMARNLTQFPRDTPQDLHTG